MWTPTALASETRRKQGTVWRVVEDQHTASTRKLVATRRDQEVLEDILESTKPSMPRDTTGLHYLLQTPFRYDAPYPVGSRFRRAGSTEGVFYASEQVRTALAELCHYRLRFFSESPDAVLPRQQERLSVFSVDYRAKRALDLTKPPFAQTPAIWRHPTDYHATQALAETARQASIDVIRYASVRDPDDGINIAMLSPTAIRSKSPSALQTWFLYLSPTEANCERTTADGQKEYWTFYPSLPESPPSKRKDTKLSPGDATSP